MKDKFYSFNQYLRRNFGERVHRISLDAGFMCPNIDGTLSGQGCSFCNNKGFAPNARTSKTLKQQIQDSIKFYYRRVGAKKFIAYFQAFTNTYADLEQLKAAYDQIKEFPQIAGLFISTRPDCVDEEKVKLISQYKNDYLVWIEYGLQTTHPRLLKIINRNHTYDDFLSALELSRKYGINVGAHLILGIPSATRQEMLDDIKKVSRLQIQGIKFHVLHVLKNTMFEALYRQGNLRLMSPQAYVKLVCDCLEFLSPKTVILRLVSTAFSDYLVAPEWINNKEKLIQAVRDELGRRGTCQGYHFNQLLALSYESISGKGKES